MNSKLTWLKTTAFFEGTILIALVFIEVPFKYWLDLPIFVRLIWPLHGTFFLAFITALLVHFAKGRIDNRLARIGAVAAFIPLGSFV